MPPDSNNSIKMEVGIEDCLHIEFEYNKSKCDVIVGKTFFLLVRIKIKHIELSIIRRETTGAPPNQYNESETITKFEIMDGAPVTGFDLTPTFRDVNKKFSTRYYLNLVLIDEEDRRYFKQQEMTIFRIPEVTNNVVTCTVSPEFDSGASNPDILRTSLSLYGSLSSNTSNTATYQVDNNDPVLLLGKQPLFTLSDLSVGEHTTAVAPNGSPTGMPLSIEYFYLTSLTEAEQALLESLLRAYQFRSYHAFQFSYCYPSSTRSVHPSYSFLGHTFENHIQEFNNPGKHT
ncbi:Vps26-domain-containing protein [Gymnopus androsaceus JB14]|uniref:Vps26-domain-containing protein n=1 Tax=Gymnopus androsaceus JB14 TaxID=1447944 RepID=A0A6A4HST1_9AGAR|nr:Vps26-domain-containing protein [Gymnopus androsaceus JB14]